MQKDLNIAGMPNNLGTNLISQLEIRNFDLDFFTNKPSKILKNQRRLY